MSRRNAFNGVKYQRLTTINSDFVDTQFDRPATVVPWKALGLAALLCFGGTCVLLVGSLLVSGHIDTKVRGNWYADRTWPLIILGAIMFLPGAYHLRIAYCAYRMYPGYSYDDIPEFD